MDSNFKFNEIRDESSVEKVIINVSQIGTKDFIIASIYQPPDSELTYDLEINRILKNFSHKELIICGDINTMNNDHKNFKEMFRNNGFSQLIDKPTRIARNTAFRLHRRVAINRSDCVWILRKNAFQI